MSALRWELADQPRVQGSLFDEPVFEREPGRGEYRGMEFLHVRSHRILNEVRNAPFGFRWTINAYRGCSHACTYCFARPTHTYLGLDADRDFERRIVVKVNAVSLLKAELEPRRWRGDLIAMGTNTDPYQRSEGKYRLTRGIVEALTERATPHPLRRVKAVEKLNDAGVPCGVLIGPVLPGLSDAAEQVEAVVDASVAAGARSISTVLLHLRPGVKEVFLGRLAGTHPHLVADYEKRYRNRVNLPGADQAALATQVREMVRARGGGAGERDDPRHLTGRSPDEAEVRVGVRHRVAGV